MSDADHINGNGGTGRHNRSLETMCHVLFGKLRPQKDHRLTPPIVVPFIISDSPAHLTDPF